MSYDNDGLPVAKYEKAFGNASIVWRVITVVYDGNCIHCGKKIPKGTKAQWFKGIGIRHEKCAESYHKSKTLEKDAIMGLLIDDLYNASRFAKLAFDTQPYNEDELFKIGHHFFDTNQFQKAIQIYNKILDKNPTSYDALISKGASYSWLDQRSKAISCYKKALKTLSGTYAKSRILDIYDRLQSEYSATGQHQKSINILKKMCKLDESNFGKLANVYFTIGDYENAIKYLRKYVKSDEIDKMMLLENCFFRLIDDQHNERDALVKINALLKKEDQEFIDLVMWKFYKRFGKEEHAQNHYNKFIEKKPVTDYDIIRKSNSYWYAKSHSKGIEFCKQYLHLKNVKYHMLYIMALLYSDKKDYQNAISTIKEMIKINSEIDDSPNKDLLNLLAKNLELLGNWKSAIDVSNVVINASSGKNQEALERVIRLLKKTKRQSEILPYLENLHNLESSNNAVSFEYVSALLEQKSFWIAKSVIDDLEKKISPDSEDFIILLIKKATCLFHLGHTPEAHEIFVSLTKKDKKLKDALDGVSLTSIKLGKRNDALRAIKESEKIAIEENEMRDDGKEILFPTSIKTPERTLKTGKNVVTKPTFRYNPEKKIADKTIVKTALNAIVALFNSNGGLLRIGITDKKPTGISPDLRLFDRKKRTEDELANYITKTIGQRLSESQIEKFIKISFPKTKSVKICEIIIPRSNIPIFVITSNKDEEFYVMESGKPTRLGPKQQIKYIKENFEELN